MAVGLQLATKNSFVRVQEDINDNLTKLDEAIDFNLLATLGIEYGGILNNTNAKVAGKAYYDTTGKKLYKCIANTSINYADASYFEALSNNDLLNSLNNLKKVETITISVPEFSAVQLIKVGNDVSLHIDTGPAMKTRYTPGSILFQIPEGFRPKRAIRFGSIVSYSNSPISYPLAVSNDGNVTVHGPISSATGTQAYYGTINYSTI